MKNVHRFINFHQKAQLKPYIDRNKELRKNKKKMIWKNIFLKLINNTVLEKTMENTRTHRDFKVIIIKARRNHLDSEPNLPKYTTKIIQLIHAAVSF